LTSLHGRPMVCLTIIHPHPTLTTPYRYQGRPGPTVSIPTHLHDLHPDLSQR
jgi:hypothetical protein